MLTKTKNKTIGFLRWTEKWTHTDMVYLAKGNFWLTIGQFASILASGLTSIAFANFLPPETFGLYKFILSFIGILAIPCLAGMHTAVTMAVAKGNEGILLPAIKTKIKWGAIGSLIGVSMAIYYFFNHNNAIAISLLIIAAFIPFYTAFALYASFLSGRKKFGVATIISIISQLFVASVTIATIYLTDNILAIIFVYFASRISFNYFILRYTIKKYRPNQNYDPENITYGKHLSFMGVFSTITENIDKIIIFHYVGAGELAIYTFALVPLDQLKSFVLKNLASLAFPKFSENSFTNLKKTLPLKIAKLTGLTSAISIFYFFVSPWIYKILFPQYLESVSLTRIMAITLALVPLGLFNTALMSQGYQKLLYFLSLITNISKIILFVILLPLFGLYGMAYTFIGVQLCESVFLLYIFMFNKKIK
ncbi:MAG: oligosaccharide flippase family protein [Candidatus Falkowbacteria bacterium]